MAGLEEIPAIIRDFTDEEMMEIALLENLQRENLNPIEESRAYKKLIETLNITQEELAKKLGKSRSYITNMIGLQTLPDSIQDLISDNKMSMGHARVLSKLENENQQKELAEKIINDGMSVRDLENLTKSTDEFERTHKIKKHTPSSNQYQYLEDELCLSLIHI